MKNIHNIDRRMHTCVGVISTNLKENALQNWKSLLNNLKVLLYRKVTNPNK